MRNVALDLGAKVIAYCEVAGGVVVKRATVTSLSTLEPLLGPDAPPARVVVEACREAWFVHSTLTRWGNEALLVDTTRVRQVGVGQHRRKTDRIDAEVLARALEQGRIPLAHVLSPERQELRRQIAIRRALVQTRAQYATTIRGLLRELGLRFPTCTTPNFVPRIRKVQLEPAHREMIEPLISAIETIDVSILKLENRLTALATKDPTITQLGTAPGVGLIVAASFVSVIDDARRFRRAHQVESYIGLVPSENTTGGRRRVGSISKQGNSYLRSLLVQAGWVILRLKDRNDPLHRWGHAVMSRRGKRIAVVALARRLAGLLWAMWRDGTVYDAAFAEHGEQKRVSQTPEFQQAALKRAVTKAQHGRTRYPEVANP